MKITVQAKERALAMVQGVAQPPTSPSGHCPHDENRSGYKADQGKPEAEKAARSLGQRSRVPMTLGDESSGGEGLGESAKSDGKRWPAH